MPHMDEFELCEKILELDVNIRVCFISAAEVNIQALREVYPKARSIGCFIKKPVTISCLVKRLSAELEQIVMAMATAYSLSRYRSDLFNNKVDMYVCIYLFI